MISKLFKLAPSRRWAALLIFGTICQSISVASETAPLQALEGQLVDLFQTSSQSVVRVKVATRTEVEGSKPKVSLTVLSGFFISSDGRILTNALPRDGVTRVWVEHQGASYIAEPMGNDRRSNLALIRTFDVPSDLQFVDIEQAVTDAPIASFAFSVTSPLDFEPTPRLGLVTGYESGFADLPFPFTHARTNISIGPAEGGSPVFNIKGQLIGISVAAIPEISSGYVVPARALQKVVHDLSEIGRVQHGTLPLGFEQKHGQDGAPATVIVKTVQPGSVAEQQGIRPGDHVVQIDETEIYSVNQLRDMLFFSESGKFVQFTIERDGTELDFAMMLEPLTPDQ